MSSDNLIGLFGDILIPPICPVCGTPTDGLLCSGCRKELAIHQKPVCQRCGRPVLYGFDKSKISNRICILCKDRDLYFKKARSFSVYKGKLKNLLRKYREKGYKNISGIITDMLEEAYCRYYVDEDFDCMDTHRKSLEEACSILSERISLPFAKNIIKKTSNVKERDGERDQASCFYKVRDSLAAWDKNILLIDDLSLTGNTLNTLSVLLKRAGASSISVLTVAAPEDRIWL